MKATGYFNFIIRWRWPVIALTLISFLALGSQAPKLRKDTSADAFIDPQDPALIKRDEVEALFNIADPILVTLVNKSDTGIYNAESMALVQWISDRIQSVDNIDPDQITSLATESNIVGTFDGMEVEDFFEELPDNPERIKWIKDAIEDFPLYQGTLVARNGQATVIVAELIDENEAAATYQSVVQLLEDAPVTSDMTLHVSGEGAVAGYLSAYIDNDAKKLNPLAAVIITIILAIAFRTVRGAIIPNIIVILTAGGTLGAMAAAGVAFYAITNGLIVCMIGIAVADSVHIFSQYYEEIAKDSEASGQEITIRAMSNMWQPITLTTFTTIAGFFALSSTTTMPPIFYFGAFGALAVFLAWFYSMTTLPAILSLLKPKPSAAFKPIGPKDSKLNFSARTLHAIGQKVLSNPTMTAFIGVAVAIIAGLGTTMVEPNEERINNFKTTEAIYIADKEVNALMDGTYYLDILVETPDVEGLYDPEVLRKIEETQHYLTSVEGIKGSTSIVDFIKQMHKAVNENDEAAYTIPDDEILIAQLFFLYTASGDPTAFEDKIDGERRQALIRATMTQNKYSENRKIVADLEQWIDEHFADSEATATITGDIPVSYHWIEPIMTNNLLSVLVCALAVILMASLLFGSASAGLLVIIPVGLSILLIYAMMGVTGIWLSVSTSMFASIAIGLGVDFAVHTTHTMKHLLKEKEHSWFESLSKLYATSGRAQFFNFVAIALGFGALVSSDVPPLLKFGFLVSIAVSAAFIASLLLLPPLALLLKPKFLGGSR
ncbi:MAG: efflux RND transporter permease subunit [Pseudohongiellaceae bacterium]|nr:efflux RND transporter permease subunit [Pseudohongiellaceae bacterium]